MKDVLLICDLDGTLIDSHAAIAQALNQACLQAGVRPRTPLDRSIVGPPLDQLLVLVTGLTDSRTLTQLSKLFIAEYDQHTCQRSQPYDGVYDMLRAAAARKVALALATNKRNKPTRAILTHLAWVGFFSRVEAVDSISGSTRRKSEMLSSIRESLGFPQSSVVYLGDTHSDAIDASLAGVAFIGAGWSGHATLRRDAQYLVARAPGEVIDYVIHNHSGGK